jgi:hypothetical protein
MPHRRFFGFRLTKRRASIMEFFLELDKAVLQAGLKALGVELARVQTLLDCGTLLKVADGVAPRMFNDFVRLSEAMLRFGAPRVVLAGSPAAKLDELFEQYVARAFVTKVYQEQIIERSVREMLRPEHLLVRYEDAKVSTKKLQIRFSFVLRIEGVVLKAIEPINLE